MAPQDLPTSFRCTLAQLELLHDDEVSRLTAEVTRLHAELEALRSQAKLPAEAEQPAAPEPDPSPFPCATVARRRQAPQALQPLDNSQSIDSMHSKDTGSDSPRVSGTSKPGPASPRGSPGLLATGKPSPVSPRSSPGLLAFARRCKAEGDGSGNSGTWLAWHESWTRATVGGINYQSGWRGTCNYLVQSKSFEIVVSVFITLNAVCVGVEASFNRRDMDPPRGLRVLEWIFIAFYIIELAMRLASQGIISALRDRWIQTDLFFVICGLADVVLSEAIANQGEDILDKAMLIRTFRLARLTRFLRYLMDFQTLWLLVQGMLNSLTMLFWTGLVTCVLLYVFSVLSLDLMRPDPAASDIYNHIATNHFDSLPGAMLTLLQGLTLDSFCDIYRPIILEKPATVLYFVPFILVVSIACLNLVTALMVNLSLEQANQEKQLQEERKFSKKAAMVELLKTMFSELDVDGSGHLDLKEMFRAPDAVQSLILEIADSDCTMASERPYMLERIFLQLDFDGDGTVEVNEFCEGLLKLQSMDGAELFQILKRCHKMMSQLMKTVVCQDVPGPVKAASDAWSV